MTERPLAGRRIVVTRARAQAGELTARLEGMGAEVVELPTIRIEPPADPGPLNRAAARAGSFDWIVFTSANAVERFWYALAEQGCDAASLCGVRICAIGPATAAELERRGVRPALVPDQAVAESAAQALLAAGPVHGARVLLPRAQVAREVLPAALRAAGAEVTEVTAYVTAQDGTGAERVRGMLDRGEIDALTFTSGSTVKSFVDLVGTDVGRAKVACIGPATAAAAREAGLAVDVQAAEHTAPGLARALADFYAAAE